MNNQHRANDEDAQINDEEKGENDQENDQIKEDGQP